MTTGSLKPAAHRRGQAPPAIASDVPDRSLGQVFTPRPVADWMVQWVCADRPGRMLDPAAGTGVFIEAIRECMNAAVDTSWRPEVIGFEIDSRLLPRLRTASSESARLRHEDFIAARRLGRFDAIVANPPYIRHHEFSYPEHVWREYDRMIGGRLSRATNLYGLFLLRIWSLLGENGRAAVITPAEWLNADFGRQLKEFLLQANALDGLIYFHHASSIFDGVLTTAAITLLRRSRKRSDGIRFIQVDGPAQLDHRTWSLAPRRTSDSLDPTAKWTPIFRGGTTIPTTAPRLGDVARCMRGIATGANTFFTLRASDLRRLSLTDNDVAPCLTKAEHIREPRLTNRNWGKIVAADHRAFLLQPRGRPSASLRAYLRHGEKLGISYRYLPSHRPVWYLPEQRKPAPILISVFARKKFRFVWNQARVLNLTAYHGIYPRDGDIGFARKLFQYLNSPRAARLLMQHCRVYADGLLKVEPRDVEALPIPHSLTPSPSSRRS